MSKKQTAVEWLIEQLENNMNGFSIAWKEEFEQALQMEREQIEHAFTNGKFNGWDLVDKVEPADYYTQTYGEFTQE